MGFRKHDITDIYRVRTKSRFLNRLPDAPETGFRHSDYYHKYFRGYTEIRKKNAKGRVIVERYYTRPWIVSGLSNRNYWLCRLLYACLIIAASALFIWATCWDIPATRSVIAALPGLLTLILLFLQTVITLFYIAAPRHMTLWDHTSTSKRLQVMACITAGGQALTGLALVGYGLFCQTAVGMSILCSAAVMLSAALSFCIFLLERKMPYSEIPNDTKLPKGEALEIW